MNFNLLTFMCAILAVALRGADSYRGGYLVGNGGRSYSSIGGVTPGFRVGPGNLGVGFGHAGIPGRSTDRMYVGVNYNIPL